MPRITINEVDNTVRGLANQYANDNIVFIPGSALKGPSIPTLCTTYAQFISIFGDTAPGLASNIMGTSWHYAANTLLMGMPIVYKRIRYNTAGSNDVDLLTKASNTVTQNVDTRHFTAWTPVSPITAVSVVATLPISAQSATTYYYLTARDETASKNAGVYTFETPNWVAVTNPAGNLETVSFGSTLPTTAESATTLYFLSTTEGGYTAGAYTYTAETISGVELFTAEADDGGTLGNQLSFKFNVESRRCHAWTPTLPYTSVVICTSLPVTKSLTTIYALTATDGLLPSAEYVWTGSNWVEWEPGSPFIATSQVTSLPTDTTPGVETTLYFLKTSGGITNPVGAYTYTTTAANTLSVSVYTGTAHTLVETKTVLTDLVAQTFVGPLNAIDIANCTKIKNALNSFAVGGITFTKLFAAQSTIDGYVFSIISSTAYQPLTGGLEVDEEDVLAEVYRTFSEVADKYIYELKFITSGVYADNVSIAPAMAVLAESRKDSIAIVDLPYNTEPENVITYFTTTVPINSSYALPYAPWQKVKLITGETKWMPPSYIFIITIAKMLASGKKNLWEAPAGVTRGAVAEIVEPEYEIGSTLLDIWQNDNPQCVNPIMKLKQYGYVIYGQRTCYYNVAGSTTNRSALQEVGVRLIANEIKRNINNVSTILTFEHNNIHTWNEFRGQMNPLLAAMKIQGALDSYQLILNNSTTTDVDINSNIVRGTIRVSIARSAEFFNITFEITPTVTTIEEA